MQILGWLTGFLAIIFIASGITTFDQLTVALAESSNQPFVSQSPVAATSPEASVLPIATNVQTSLDMTENEFCNSILIGCSGLAYFTFFSIALVYILVKFG